MPGDTPSARKSCGFRSQSKELVLKPGSIAALDRGYVDFGRFRAWTHWGIFFVTRMKDNCVYSVLRLQCAGSPHSAPKQAGPFRRDRPTCRNGNEGRVLFLISIYFGQQWADTKLPFPELIVSPQPSAPRSPRSTRTSSPFQRSCSRRQTQIHTKSSQLPYSFTEKMAEHGGTEIFEIRRVRPQFSSSARPLR